MHKSQIKNSKILYLTYCLIKVVVQEIFEPPYKEISCCSKFSAKAEKIEVTKKIIFMEEGRKNEQ